MKCGARVALGVAGGYFLGRTRKMKLALMLAGMGAGRRAGGPGALLGQATKLLGQSPEVAHLSDELRGRLVEAGKGAVVAVTARQIEALADRLSSRVGELADIAVHPAGSQDGGGAPGASDQDEQASNGAGPADDRAAEAEAADEAVPDGGAGDEEEAPHRPVRARSGGKPSGTATMQRPARAATGRKTGRPARAKRGAGDE